ncbi:hypothetical protein, partial [Microseira wollei]|uniref:hypothetical protein n=1 Tax=Microseira wollei TaxID=467598 RepID=UPI001CFC72F6
PCPCMWWVLAVGARQLRSLAKGRRSAAAVPLHVVGVGGRGTAIKIFPEKKMCCCRAPACGGCWR